MTSKSLSLSKSLRVYAAELICSIGVSGFQNFELEFV